jgi:hypothetical protein
VKLKNGLNGGKLEHSWIIGALQWQHNIPNDVHVPYSCVHEVIAHVTDVRDYFTLTRVWHRKKLIAGAKAPAACALIPSAELATCIALMPL